mmetsp:Transcript_27406/g.72334  ORF Transcript_27406/g.72334 Transcript_27406/m.72334 type:complete len:397 (-) Transcript_27406:435-1625(-)
MSWHCARMDQGGFGGPMDPYGQGPMMHPRALAEMQGLDQQHFLTSTTTREQEELLRRKAEHMESLDIATQHHYPPAFGGRSSRLTDKALREHFHLPLSDVAKKFGMCTTAFKKLCRKQGVMQWPQRTLRSLEKKIASLHAEQKFSNDQNHIEDQIRKLEAKRESILSGHIVGNLDLDEIGASPSDDSSANSACSGGSSPRASDVMGQLALDDASSTASSSSLHEDRNRRSSHGEGFDYKDHVDYGAYDRAIPSGAPPGGVGPSGMRRVRSFGAGSEISAGELMYGAGPAHPNPALFTPPGRGVRGQMDLPLQDPRRGSPSYGAGGYWMVDGGADLYGAGGDPVRAQTHALAVENSRCGGPGRVGSIPIGISSGVVFDPACGHPAGGGCLRAACCRR